MFSWGDGSRGQLRSRSKDFTCFDVPQPVVFCSETISEVSCGEQHTLFVTVDGRVLSCGRNNKGQLGRGKSKDSRVVEGLEGVVAVACGQEHCLALCESGGVYSWGRGDEGQLGIDYQRSKMSQPRCVSIQAPWPVLITQVACGNVHSLALSAGGDVLSWGKNSHGQLGLGKAVDFQTVPSLVRALLGVPVTQISAGGAHTLVLTLHGLVYCCGANNAGQLGLKRVDEKGRFGICSVPALRDRDIRSICCGEAHTAVLTRNGHVYTFGEGAQGQLGHSSTANELQPRMVEGLDGPASQIACGSHHTLVLGSSNRLWAFGSGVKGQLGNGRSENSTQPTMVEPTWAGVEVQAVSDFNISVGWNSNFVFFRPEKATSPLQPVGKLNDAQLQRWLTITNGDQNCAEAERISRIFSSSSSLVGSFIKDIEPQAKMTANSVRIDLQAASEAFDKLLQVSWIRKAIDIRPLVKTLCCSSSAMKAADIFLLLPVCPLLHEDRNVINLVLPLAVAITNLGDSVMEILQGWWGSMGQAMMSKHIQVWKHALSFLLRANLMQDYIPEVKATLEVLKYLHRANRKPEKSKQVPFTDFYTEELGQDPIMLQTDVTLWRQIKWSQVQEVELTPAIFCRFPFLLDLQSKASHQLMHQQSFTGREGPGFIPEETPTPVFMLKIRRTHLLEDTFRQLAASDHENFQKQLKVQFVDESKLTLVHQKDFFLHTFDEFFAPDSGMFMYDDTKTLVWFPSKPKHETKKYFLFGILCGLALNNNNIVHLPFPLAMFKKLLGVKVTLEDLTEFSPVLGESLRYILYDYTDDEIENLDMTYSITWDDIKVELDPKEMGKLVTSKNKKEFVQSYVNYALNKSVERVFEEFKRGFFKVCARDVVEMFYPEELRTMMVGREDYDWDRLKQNTVYERGYHGNHPVIKMFWEVFDELSHDQKKAFLLFLTGCGRVPILGMDQIRMTIRVRRKSSQNHFPESLTCQGILDLPMYQSKERLQTLLTEALNHNRGFWKE
ncbi:probable E3 ubiquitin-protein ligase HERC6 isoform X2 [Clupea harengus]|uniref:Probable E3 ubiquitin-protein ligase HERC6 isoform X2 n=1 Tax=Clupea harengus TaxID=7950 RepID=A0A6P8EW86_CLUHA|nr:probable E3 ubiquitin-protein ligase HERC6 isoform X2 [Clupea harengus]